MPIPADPNLRHETRGGGADSRCDKPVPADSARSACGPTPLELALFKGRTDVAEWLIDNGAVTDDEALIVFRCKKDNCTKKFRDTARELGLKGVYCGEWSDDHGIAACRIPQGLPLPSPEPQADYTGLYANAAFAVVAGAFTPSWVDTQTFAFNAGDKLVTGQSLSVPLDDFTFAAKRVQVNDLTDYEFSVKWDWEF